VRRDSDLIGYRDRQMRLTIRSALIFLTVIAALQAQESAPTMRVHGEATVSAEPDQAQFDLGVVTQAATAKEAMDQNAKQTSLVIEELRTVLARADIKTINLSVNPNYRYPKDGTVAAITGYTANNTVRLLLNDLSNLERIIEVSIKSGANSINRLTFSLRDEEVVRARALANAASQAQASADALSASLKVKLVRLVRIEEGQPVIVSPAREISFEKTQSTDITPVSPGTINVHADVNLTYEIQQ